MRKVSVTVGPRGSGKSTYCRRFVEVNPDVKLVSRDAILLKLFGSVDLDTYSGGHFVAYREMWSIVEKLLKDESVNLILDCWNGFEDERRNITRKLHHYGADEIEAWQFIVPEDVCVEWFLQKEAARTDADPADIARSRTFDAERCRRDYQLYHQQPVDLNQGFDTIRVIDLAKLYSLGQTESIAGTIQPSL